VFRPPACFVHTKCMKRIISFPRSVINLQNEEMYAVELKRTVLIVIMIG